MLERAFKLLRDEGLAVTIETNFGRVHCRPEQEAECRLALEQAGEALTKPLRTASRSDSHATWNIWRGMGELKDEDGERVPMALVAQELPRWPKTCRPITWVEGKHRFFWPGRPAIDQGAESVPPHGRARYEDRT